MQNVTIVVRPQRFTKKISRNNNKDKMFVHKLLPSFAQFITNS